MPVSRRTFLATAGAQGVAAQLAAAPQTSGRQPVTQTPYPLASPHTDTSAIHIVTRDEIDKDEAAQIRAAAPNVELQVCAMDQEFEKYLPDAEVLIGNPSPAVLERAEKLKWVQINGAGVEWMSDELRASPVVVTNCARTFAPGITETGVGLLLALTRRIVDYMPQFARHQMHPIGDPRSDDYMELAGRTMAIAGMGGIGSAMARRAHYGFEMRVIATDAKPLPKPEYVAELHPPAWFPEMVREADVVVAAAPLTPLTKGMFSEAIFRSMRRGTIFIALSRGKLYDDMALVRVLQDGHLRGAGLDVFPVEPPPPYHPIFDLKNVVMTPHTSGWGPEREQRLIALYAENVRRYASGEPLLNVVDKQRGY